jgi:hypothetical protein
MARRVVLPNLDVSHRGSGRHRRLGGGSPSRSSGTHKTAGKGDTVLYTSPAGKELVLKSWGVLEPAPAARP